MLQRRCHCLLQPLHAGLKQERAAGVCKTFTSTTEASVPSDLGTLYERRIQVGFFEVHSRCHFVRLHHVFFLPRSMSSFRSHIIKVFSANVPVLHIHSSTDLTLPGQIRS